jgi:hypothetical protein
MGRFEGLSHGRLLGYPEIRPTDRPPSGTAAAVPKFEREIMASQMTKESPKQQL